MSENMFLDVIADVNSDYVEEVLFVPQIEQDSEDLQKYRKKSNVGKIFGTAAACVAIVGVGVAAILLNKSGFFTEPAQNTETITTTEAESEMTTTAETNEAQTTPEETQAAEKKVYVYGEVEIPDIPSTLDSVEGFTDEHLDENMDFSKCLDSMVFETHTVGEYKISLVGDSVRTDKANFPGSIYAEKLRVEVEKNGVKLGESDEYHPAGAYYCNSFTYVAQFVQFRLFEDKIGTYIDLYELEQPVISMRYYYDDNPARIVKKAVEFVSLQNDEIGAGHVGVSEKGTGIMLNMNPDNTIPRNYVALVPNNENGTYCRLSLFEAEEFKITNANTLVDEEAGIKYTFDFSDPTKFEMYTSEKINVTAYIPECLNSLEGIPGDIVTSNITNIEYSSEKPDVWHTAKCDGFVYLAQPTGISINSAENKEMFDEAHMFTGNINTNDSDYEYKRYYVGDKIGDLTVKAAWISFTNMVEENVPDKCRKYMSVDFDGTVTLTGYINSYTSEDGFVESEKERAVYFAPDAESGKKLPVFKGFNVPLESTLTNEYMANFSFYGEHAKINLGNTDDFSDFPDNEAVKVKVTISNLNYYYAQGGPVSHWASADLISYEVTE